MKFRQFLSELHNIETGQAIEAHETTEESSSSVLNPEVMVTINRRFMVELDDIFISPEHGIQKIRKVLHRFGLDMPALYNADPMGDEVVFELKQFGQPHGVTISGEMDTGPDIISGEPDLYLYFIYYLDENGKYDFHAEIINNEEFEDILSDEDSEIEELE
jgi:hypothetical protein